jgi:hypothetical protein
MLEGGSKRSSVVFFACSRLVPCGDQVKKKPKVSHSDGASADFDEGVSPRK